MRELGELTDAVLVSQDGQTFACHRLILALGSAYFKAKFSSSWSAAGKAHGSLRLASNSCGMRSA